MRRSSVPEPLRQDSRRQAADRRRPPVPSLCSSSGTTSQTMSQTVTNQTYPAASGARTSRSPGRRLLQNRRDVLVHHLFVPGRGLVCRAAHDRDVDRSDWPGSSTSHVADGQRNCARPDSGSTRAPLRKVASCRPTRAQSAVARRQRATAKSAYMIVATNSTPMPIPIAGMTYGTTTGRTVRRRHPRLFRRRPRRSGRARTTRP